MNSVRRFAIVILLTIAGSLLLTEARYHGEESIIIKHRHRHHRQEPTSTHSHHRMTMQKHLMDPDSDDYDDTLRLYDEKQKKHQRPKKGLTEDSDDDDDDNDDDDDDYDYDTEISDYPEKLSIINHRKYTIVEHNSEVLNRRNQRFVIPKVHKIRPDTKLHHSTDYTSRNRDHVYPAVPNNTKEDYEDSKTIKPLSRLHYRHSTHHLQHHQRHNMRNNDIYVPKWRNTWTDDSRVDLADSRRWSRRKSRLKQKDNDDDGDDGGNRTKVNNIFGIERKWRNNNLQSYGKHLHDDDEDIWKELGDYDDTDNDDEDFDGINDDYFEDISEEREKPPYRTYDEIIKRLTLGETTDDDREISVKRDYRNTGDDIKKFLMKDAYGNFKYNGTKVNDIGEFKNNQDNLSGDERKLKDFKYSKLINQGKTKSLDSDYVDDYGNNDNGEKKEGDDGDEEDADVYSKKDTVIQVEYPSNQTEPVYETSVPTTSTIPEPPVKITSRPIITITTQRTYQHRNTTSISQQSAPNGSPWIRSVEKSQTKESTIQPLQSKQKAGMREAIQHAIKVRREGNCQWPRARVIPVRDVYPNPSSTYIPHCAILHRCSDDTGCCGSEALTCVPKHSQRVELYFYTTSVGAGSVVEKLSFYNHTECECKEKGDYVASTVVQPRNEHQLTPPPQNIRVPPQKKPCRCPSEFTPRITPDGECQCKCFESDEECIRARRGKVYFSTRDRICIQKQECAMPTCEFGEYIMRQGKCPRKKDKIESITNYPSNNYHHRQRS